MRRFILPIICMLLSVGLSCASEEGPADANNGSNTDGKGDTFDASTTVCTAIRGNGELVPAHFGALARITEHYGMVDATAGGSSASISSFLLSSIAISPSISDCAGESCSDLEEANRAALLLKSFQGYIEFMAQSDEVAAAQSIMPLVAKIKSAGIETLLEEDPAAANETLQALLQSDDLRSLVNPELMVLLQTSENPEYHVRDLLAAAQGFGSFDATDPKILVRPGFVSFPALVDQIDILASFYAGYGEFDSDAMESWMQACAAPGRGKLWSEVRGIQMAEGSTCGQTFYAMFGQYREVVRGSQVSASRANDQVGTYMAALISTSVITGAGVDAWNGARDQYLSGQDPTLDLDFSDIRFGYFGDADSLKAVEKTNQRPDLKSQKALSLGSVTWREALSLSPAEPGLARAFEIEGNQVSAGGWPDLHPVLILKDLGCDKVIYVTRTDPESNFARGVARLLGMDEAEDSALYDLNTPESSFSTSIAEADAVWCTNWNNFEASEVEANVSDAYNARMITTDEFFMNGDLAYQNSSQEKGIQGCSL